MRYCILLLFLELFVLPQLWGQEYIVSLTDKKNTGFNIQSPDQFLSPVALQKRRRFSIAVDSSDLPVNKQYVASITNIPNVKLVSISKWLNQLLISTTDKDAINKINALPFVNQTKQFSAKAVSLSKTAVNQLGSFIEIENTPVKNSTVSGLSYGSSRAQIELHHGEYLHEKGLLGQGIKVAVFDGGFLEFNTNKAFDSVRKKNNFKGIWDLVSNDGSVQEDDAHGTYCLSVMAAYLPGYYIGTAPEAAYYLFRTENVISEFPVEEHHWVVAAEMADSLGVDIISSSLGYSTFDLPSLNYVYASMNGYGTTVSKGATLASKKGMLVVNSAGNSGNDSWKYITAPADADNILAVGAVNLSKQVAPFSSFGPSADGRIKPDVASVGWNASIINSLGSVSLANGTSFSAPLISGLTACLWQAFPECTNLEIIDAIKKSSDLYLQPDVRTGYGIPDMKKAFDFLEKNRILKNAGTLLNGAMLKAFPIPFSERLTILYDSRTIGNLSLELISLDGKVIKSMQKQVDNPGVQLIYWDGLSYLPKGQYVLRYRDATGSGSLKFMN